MAITITTGRPLFQREIYDGVTSQGPVVVAGTFTGSPTSITISIRKVADDSEVASGVDSSPTAGAYSITVADVPESILANASGDLYYAHATAAGTGDTASSKGVWQFHVGRWLGLFGQSNGDFLFTGASSPPSPLSGTYYRNSGYASVPNANGVIELLNGLVTHFGVPWGVVQYCVSGSSLESWREGLVNYNTFIGRITGGPGDVECLQIVHGESAAVDTGISLNNMPVHYAATLDGIHDSLTTAISRTKAQCPLMVNGLARETSGAYGDVSWHRAQHCVVYAAETYANIHYSASMIDAGLVDTIHWDIASRGNFGKRAALAWAKLAGLESESCEWSIVSAKAITETRTIVNLSDTINGDFSPSSGITGFEVSSDGIIWIAATGTKVNANKIELVHAELQHKNRAVRFGYGATPDISNLPKETFANAPPQVTSIWVVSSGGSNPIFQHSTVTLPERSGAVVTWANRQVAGKSGATLYAISQQETFVTVVSALCNGDAMTVVDSENGGGKRQVLYSYVLSQSAASVVITFSGDPFNSGGLWCVLLLAGTASFVDMVTENDSGATASVSVATSDQQYIFAASEAIFPSPGPTGGIETGTIGVQVRGILNATQRSAFLAVVGEDTSNGVTASSSGSTSVRLTVAVFDAPTPGSWKWENILAETSDTLVLSSVTLTDDQIVRCVATDDNGSTNSNEAELTVT